MYTYKYPRPALTVDIVAFSVQNSKLSVLLIERASDPYKGMWALPGGFVEIDENLEAAAERELRRGNRIKRHLFGAILYLRDARA